MYGQLVADANLGIPPRAGWLLLRLGEHRGEACARLASRLSISLADLDGRLADLVDAGLVRSIAPDGSQPAELTRPGEEAYARLFAAREARVARLLDGWHPELHPRLLALLTEMTHELAASHERPGPDLELAERAAE